MFLSKHKGANPGAARSDLDGIAQAHAGTGQKILAMMVAIGASVVILGGVAWKFVMPMLSEKKAAPEQSAKTTEVKPAAEIKVPLDLDRGTSSTNMDKAAAAVGSSSGATGTDPAYQPMPGLAGDARPSSAPAHRRAGTEPVGAPPANTGNRLPPGMEDDAGAYTQVQTGGKNSTQADSRIPDRKLNGDLGDFGDAPASRSAAMPRAAERSDECAGIHGGPEAEAECIRRMPARVPVTAPATASAGTTPVVAPQNGGVLSNQLVGIQTPNGGVSLIPNPHLTLAKGEPITCTLTTAIRTEQAGFVECVTDFPIYSMDGKVLLAERGTRINGEYSRDASPGSRSIFVLWTRAVTPAPHFVTFDLFSPGSDRLGRSGIDGDVDNKYWERYSGPLMFSLLQDVSAVATAKAAGTSGQGSGVFVLPSTQSTGTNAVAELLKQGSEVKRTIYRNQGDTIAITVARYIDFTSIYKLRSVKGRN